MSSSFMYKWVSCFVVIFCARAVTSQDISLTIPLNKTVTQGNKELYGDFITLNRTSTLQVNLSPASKSVSFVIFQVHSFIYNVSLYNNTLTTGSYVNGTNVGLYSSTKKLDSFFVYNPNEVDLKLYVSVHGYSQNDPIPGGCNMEFPVPISPFLHTTYTKDYVLVNGAAAKQLSDKDCNKATEQKITFYRVYLPTRDYTEDTYFDGVRSMLTLDKIAENGDEVPETGVMWATRRMLSAYAGTGSVYVAVAYSGTGYAVYVPSYTYACDLLVEGDCVLFDDFPTKLLCALLVFIGLFICYFGHWFFRTEMFVIGLTSGGLVTYVVLAIIADLDRNALIGASLLSGMFTGAIWLIFWYYYGMPLFAVMLPTLNMGFLVAAIAYYRLPGGIEVLEEDFNFWTFYIFVMLISSVTLISMTFLSNILCCATLGAYAIVYSIDCYIGSNLKYILINILRRAIVPKFNWAVLSPPFELNEALLTVLWVALALSGSLLQHCHSRGRPPFPPPPRSLCPRLARLRATQYGTGPQQLIYAYQVPPVNVEPPVHIVPPSAPAQQNDTERTPLLS